jgi:hypothetical protein
MNTIFIVLFENAYMNIFFREPPRRGLLMASQAAPPRLTQKKGRIPKDPPDVGARLGAANRSQPLSQI